MSWNYRLMRHTEPDRLRHAYSVHEVYYDDAGKVNGWSHAAKAVYGETRDEVIADLVLMADCVAKAVLDADTADEVEPALAGAS